MIAHQVPSPGASVTTISVVCPSGPLQNGLFHGLIWPKDGFGSNEFTGEIVTLSVQAKGVRIVPDLRAGGDNAPDWPPLSGPV